MVVYLLCWADATPPHPRFHAKHYLGSTDDLEGRLQAHRSGRGARLMEVISNAGIGFRLARTWEGGRDRERKLKRRGGHRRLCPFCKEKKKR